MTVDEDFLARVGHDLRGELATMVTGIHYLLRYEADLGATARQMLDRVNGAGQRMRRLLDEFDDAVWIDGGGPSALQLEPCQVDLLITSVLERLRQVIQSREVAIDLQVPPDLPRFNADARLCGAAIEYVLDFAMARSRKKTVHLTASAADGRTVLSIADEGGSIPDDARSRILEPFVEKDLVPKPEPGQRRRERLGLGLAIARGILNAHGGSVAVENASDGQGAIFHLTLSHAGDQALRSGASTIASAPVNGVQVKQAG
jgi:two-component system, OmpR family, sensor kinase